MAAARPEGGFGALDTMGRLPADAPADGVLTCRKIHAYALATALGDFDGADLVDHGLRALRSTLRDPENGGWYKSSTGEDRRKEAYLHAFVALAASTAVSFGHDARDILDEAVSIIETRFWSDNEGAMRERFEADWTGEMDYRGANANMHALEAFLALHDATGNAVWLDRGFAIAGTIIERHTRANGHAVIEHFDSDWNILREFNADRPRDDLRPYGTTPGHYAEWSHLLLRLEMALQEAGRTPTTTLRPDAEALFAATLRDGWKDEPAGIVYTVGWDNQVSVENRPHWVIAEAAVAAQFLALLIGTPHYFEWRNRLWQTIRETFVDETYGGWWNEVDGRNRPSETIYRGKPDLYHAYQALLSARLPAAPTYAAAVRRAIAKG